MGLIKETEYFDAKGKLLKAEWWCDEQGLRQGESKSYWPNRRMFNRSNYVNDERDGEYKEWHSNGQLHYHMFLLNGKRHGEFRRWDDKGNLSAQAYYFESKDITRDLLATTDRDPVMIKLMYGISMLKVRKNG